MNTTTQLKDKSKLKSSVNDANRCFITALLVTLLHGLRSSFTSLPQFLTYAPNEQNNDSEFSYHLMVDIKFSNPTSQ